MCAKRSLLGVCVYLHVTLTLSSKTGMTGRCSLFGRHHVHTFDGVLYEFPGDCSYLLAGDCSLRSFTLLGDFHNGKRTGVTLFLGDAFELHLSVDGLLSQGEKRLPIPYASHAVFVGSELGFYKLWSEEFGFTLILDNAANVALMLSAEYANHTCGLCGNFNSVPADDFTAQEGFLTEDSYDFANSWAMKGADQTCERVSSPSKSCNSTEATEEILSSCSVFQTSGVFLHCAHLLSPEPFLSLCQQEACHCEQKDVEDCYCPFMLEYARSCHAHGLRLRGWLEESKCYPKCPIGMQYSECTKSCSTTCHSLNIKEVCKDDCADGCVCPVGKVLDGNRCVEVSECSCMHMGQHFPPGSSVSQDCNTCVCRHGSWECTNEGCPGECLVVGQSHFKSFDSKFFTFTGRCQYLLTKDCEQKEFSVIIENVQCADDQEAVCTRSVTLNLLTLEDMSVKLKHGGMVSVNGMDIQTPMHHGRLLIQKTVQSSVRVKFGDSFRLDWDGRGRVLLKLGPKWAGHTCGLCGNFNGNQGDDFLTDSGLIEASPQAFGQAWQINGDCEFVHKYQSDPCAINPKRVHFAEEECAVLMSAMFSPCHILVNPSPFQRFCRYDVCACGDGEECLCSALAAYAAACSAKGVLLEWRSPSLCGMECSGGQVHEACGSECERTCLSLSGAEVRCEGERVCEEGCFCPAGKYLSPSGECVTADLCPCFHDGQLYQPKDVYADHNRMCYCENGVMRCSSSSKEPSFLSDLFYDDDIVPSRERRSARCSPPLVRVECDSGEKGLECARTCQNLDLPCSGLSCIPGCLCPPGTVRHRKDCIAPEQCPCYHNNNPYAAGQTITVDCNTCVCENRKWRCSQQLCDGVCRIVGEGHYITFDGLKFSFPGLCQYVLVQDMCHGEEGSFRVLVENEACGVVGRRCAKAITVYYKGGLIEMQHGEVVMKRPVPQSSQVEIVRSGQFYTLLLGKDISFNWDRGTRLLVHVSAAYRGRVCGLCGNFDSNINNDLMSSNNQLEVDSSHFGDSWKVVPSCADVTQIPIPCSDNIIKLVTVEQSCRLLTSQLFKECNSQVDAEPYVEMCVESVCSCPSVGDCACFCDIIAAYAQACSEMGIFISWRSNDLCPMSCEELNPRVGSVKEEFCQWKYNSCGPACPATCQHPDPLPCSLTCVEGCHAYCPPGQLLDEVTMRCVVPSHCHVCIHEGERISHGTKVILNHNDPTLCKICHCDDNTLSCEACASINMSPSATPAPNGMFTTLAFTTSMPEGMCDRAMDLAFLLDGSEALSEDEFQMTKEFIVGVVDRFRMGSAHTRATVLLYHSGVKTYNLQVQKWLFKKTVRDLHYTGGDAAFLDEAVKYLAINIYDKNKREHAGRVAIILTASANPRPVRSIVKMLRKKTITTLSVVLGPGVNMAQINDITMVNPDNRAYVLSSTAELHDHLLELTDYLCTLGLEPEVVKTTTPMPTPETAQLITKSPSVIPNIEPNLTTKVPNMTSGTPSDPSAATTPSSPLLPATHVTFILEGSDSVGEVNFRKSISFLEEVITQLSNEKKLIRITVIQYSVTVTVEISHWEIRQQRSQLLQRLREIRWRGGNRTNTGTAVTTTLERLATAQPPAGPQPPQLVFLMTENPPTDTVTRPPLISSRTHVYPIGVGSNIRETDLLPLSFPQRPLLIGDYNHLSTLVHRVVNITHTTVVPHSPTLPPLVLPTYASLPSSVPCTKPVDVLFLLKAGEYFEDMKMFVEAFVEEADVGINGTWVSVVQYGDANTVELWWKNHLSKANLLEKLAGIQSRTAAASALGSALQLAVQTSINPVSGGRMGVAKAIVMLVMDKSVDDVGEAVHEALAAGVSVFPIGIGPSSDVNELSLLGHRGNQDNTLHLNSIDQLKLLLSLDKTFKDRICRAGPPGVCVDDKGKERKPGESWLLDDGCHSVLCHPSGAVTLQNHKVNCDKLEPPACRNNMVPIKVQDKCGCHWDCPCVCMGTSTNHVVRFDGLALRLDREGLCSYTLLTLSAEGHEGSEIKLHTGPCQESVNFNQICMKALEVTNGPHKLTLKDDTTVTVDQEVVSLPWRFYGVELVLYGGVMLQLVSNQGYSVTFTPQSNEFTITIQNSVNNAQTVGLCGACEEDKANVLSVRNGSSTTNHQAFISDWTVTRDGGVCLPKRTSVCVSGAAMGCQALHSEAFLPCHSHISVQLFLTKCEEAACVESDVCEVISAYARLCRQRGVCVDWRNPHLCPLQCPNSMEYNSCRTGCVEDCRSIQALPGDWSVARGNESLCMDTPTEGCFCTGGTVLHHGQCISPEACGQCVDQHGHTYSYMQSWIPDSNPCLICMCLDQQRINCTAIPCNDVKVPTCGSCEILREKSGSRCCPEYECVCDLVNCDLPQVPNCEDGETLVLKNPGECQPVHECVCKKEECALKAPPNCSAHQHLLVKKTRCCDVFECLCNCQNSTQTCPVGFITSSLTNSCGCTETKCSPDKVCVVNGLAHLVASEWEEGCERCTCTQLQDKDTSLHVAQCSPPSCDRNCPLGSNYIQVQGSCCGKCTPTSCVESEGEMRGDTINGAKLRHVGEVWHSSHNQCILHQCVKVGDEMFVSSTNVSCELMKPPACTLGTELHCETVDCCPRCYCAPVQACILNHTVIAAGERVMVDECTHCECTVEKGAVMKYKLSCRQTTCPTCPLGYALQSGEGSCCGRCVATACYARKPDGNLINVQLNATIKDGCDMHTCSLREGGELVLETKTTICPPFDREECLRQGGTISHIGETCCEMCAQPVCRKTTGTPEYMKVDDCQSEQPIKLNYCQGECHSKSTYSLQSASVKQECVCCSAVETEPVSVSILCGNGTRSFHKVLSVTRCDCQSKHCT